MAPSTFFYTVSEDTQEKKCSEKIRQMWEEIELQGDVMRMWSRVLPSCVTWWRLVEFIVGGKVGGHNQIVSKLCCYSAHVKSVEQSLGGR